MKYLILVLAHCMMQKISFCNMVKQYFPKTGPRTNYGPCNYLYWSTMYKMYNFIKFCHLLKNFRLKKVRRIILWSPEKFICQNSLGNTVQGIVIIKMLTRFKGKQIRPELDSSDRYNNCNSCYITNNITKVIALFDN
jgi:hypothetical protein